MEKAKKPRRIRSLSPSPSPRKARSVSPAEKKKKKKRGRKALKTHPGYNVAPDRGFGEEGSYWARTAGPRRKPHSDDDLEILSSKRKAPKATLPGKEHKPKRKDEKAIALRAKVPKIVANLDAGIANIVEANDVLIRTRQKSDTIDAATRADISALKKRIDESASVVDPDEDEPLHAQVLRIDKRRRAELNARHVREGELETMIEMNQDLLETDRQVLKDFETTHRKNKFGLKKIAQYKDKIERWEYAIAQHNEELKGLRETASAAILDTADYLVDELFEEEMRADALEDLPPVPKVPSDATSEKGSEAEEKAPEPRTATAGEQQPAVDSSEDEQTIAEIHRRQIKRKSGTVTAIQQAEVQSEEEWWDPSPDDSPEERVATKTSRADVLAVHGSGGMSPDEYESVPSDWQLESDGPTGNVPYGSLSSGSSGLESDSSGRGATGRGYQVVGQTRTKLLRSGYGQRRHKMGRFLRTEQADEIPEEDAASSVGYHAPEAPVRKRRLKTKQSAHDRNFRRKIMPVLKMANFSLRKVSPGRYIVSARDVSQGVVEQIRALLQKIPGKRILVDGRIFGKQSAFREIIRILNEKNSVEVSL